MNEKYKLITIILLNFFCCLFTAHYGSIITVKIQGYFWSKNFHELFIFILCQCGIFLLDNLLTAFSKSFFIHIIPNIITSTRIYLNKYLYVIETKRKQNYNNVNLIIIFFDMLVEPIFGTMIPQLLYAIYNIYYYFQICWWLGCYEILNISIFLLLSFYLFSMSNSYDKKSRALNNDLEVLTADLFSHQEIIRLYHRKNFAFTKTRELINAWAIAKKEQITKQSVINQMFITIYLVFFKIAVPNILCLLYYPEHIGIFVPISIWSYYRLYYGIFAQLHLISLIFTIKYLCDSLELEKKIDEGNNILLPTGPDIILKNLSISLYGKQILSNVNLNIKFGNHVYIIGESGCGKSTLVKCLIGLLDSEDIFIDDKKISSYEKSTLSKLIAYVSQSTEILDLTIKENIIFDDEINENMYEACRLADLYHTITNYEELVKNLSGGQRQRVNIARAIYHILQNKDTIKILVLDEPTSALDEKTAKLVMKNLLKLSLDLNLTFICITHNLQITTINNNNLILSFVSDKDNYKIEFSSYEDHMYHNNY